MTIDMEWQQCEVRDDPIPPCDGNTGFVIVLRSEHVED